MSDKSTPNKMPRREFIQKSLIASGAVFMGMQADSRSVMPPVNGGGMPLMASSHSGWGGPRGNNGVGNGEDPQPPGNPPVNDGPGTGPGNPGNRGGGGRPN